MGGGEGVHPGAHGAHGDVDDVRVAVQLAGEGDAALHPAIRPSRVPASTSKIWTIKFRNWMPVMNS